MKPRHIFAVLGGWGLFCAAPGHAADPAPSGHQPNVVLILADDLGWSDLGCYGADLHETPPVLRNPAATLVRDALYFHYPHYYPTTTPAGAVRAGDWKLTEYFEDQRTELFNLRDDPAERNDLTAGEPGRADELRRKLDRWRRDVGAQLPRVNAGFTKKQN